MSWLAVLKLLLSLAGSVAKIVADQQLLKAGEAQAVAEGLRRSHDAIARAQAARRGVDHSPGGVHGDKYNRDGPGLPGAPADNVLGFPGQPRDDKADPGA